nr:uncharacterized protein LOC117275561 [Nicotiana tomentosiformis]
MYKLFSEQREGEIEKLQDKMDAAQKEHADLVEQVQQKLDRIDQLRVVAEWDTLGLENKIAKLVIELTRDDAEEMVAQARAEVEAAQDRLKVTVEYVMWQSRRKALKEVHSQDFDLSANIENAKRLEVEAKDLTDPDDEEGSEGSYKPEDREDPDGLGDKAGSGDDHA